METIQLNTGAMPQKIPGVWGLAPKVSTGLPLTTNPDSFSEGNSKMPFFESVS